MFVMEVKFYRCSTCGNVICKVVDSGVVPHCCGSEMILMKPKSVDNGREKHLPEVEWDGDHKLKVRIGSQPHPCTPEHYISMIALEMDDGICIKTLQPCCDVKDAACADKLAASEAEAKDVVECCDGKGLLSRIFGDECKDGGDDKDEKSAWPHAKFRCCRKKAKGVYAYCNIHGLWYLPLNEKE